MLQLKIWRHWRDAFDLIVANSNAVKQTLVADGIGPVEVVWNGVPVRSAGAALSLFPQIAYAGRLVREKGVDVLLMALRAVVQKLPDARLVIAGDGPERERLERMTRAFGLTEHVTLLARVSQEQLDREFAGVWVHAVPSRWAEPFGLVAPEAMMRGTAVVASACGGLSEIVEHGRTGLLVPPENPDALATALLRLLSDRALTEELGRAGRERALREFSADGFVDRFVEIYDRIRGVPPSEALPATSGCNEARSESTATKAAEQPPWEQVEESFREYGRL